MITFSYIFQIHNREDTVQELLAPFIEAQNNGHPSQLIVCSDGSTDHTNEKILQIMTTAKYAERNTVMIMYDVFEVPLTWRAIQIAEGEFIVLIQDDDYYSSMEFADKALTIFRQYSHLAALSPKHGLMLDDRMNIRTIYGEYLSSDLPITTPTYNEYGVRFVHIIDRAPMFIRREHYNLIGGLDLDLKRAVYNDWDMCLSWAKKGLLVGIYHADSYQFRRWHAGSILPGAVTHIYAQENRQKVFKKHYGR